MIQLVAAVVLAMTTPSPRALDLARQVAQAGMLAGLLDLVEARETEALMAEHGELDAEARQQLRQTAHRVFLAGRARLVEALAAAYAERLREDELREILRFNRSPAGRRYRQVMPQAMTATMQAAAGLDFRRDVRSAFCQERQLLCEPRR